MTTLVDIIKAQYLHKADAGESYVLSNGTKTDHYYDIKAMMGYSNHMYRLADELTSKIEEEDIKFRCIGGTELGGIPLATVLQIRYDHIPIPVCFIRKEQRLHGMKRMIEGVTANPVLLVDDVFSSGQTIINANCTCVAEGLKVSACIVVVNRMENIQVENLEKFIGFKIYSLFTESDFGY
jgi:orotate phosphoribosyltransferase